MFNYKKFLCAVPAPVLRDYLGERQFEGTDDFNWSAPEDVFVKALGAVIDDGDAERRSALISDLQEAADLAMSRASGRSSTERVMVEAFLVEWKLVNAPTAAKPVVT